ncbi:hypothetical protein, partial [Mesorhizobium sp. M7A.F.Ca.ET.027.03.2.1]|uniref:hypothetical protein n=1 Tax=Mesorhizobium sp. M7A.F.Ca.ET.027.03.2.1 TaxID=2496656 RepID=UPI001AEC946B
MKFLPFGSTGRRQEILGFRVGSFETIHGQEVESSTAARFDGEARLPCNYSLTGRFVAHATRRNLAWKNNRGSPILAAGIPCPDGTQSKMHQP